MVDLALPHHQQGQHVTNTSSTALSKNSADGDSIIEYHTNRDAGCDGTNNDQAMAPNTSNVGKSAVHNHAFRTPAERSVSKLPFSTPQNTAVPSTPVLTSSRAAATATVCVVGTRDSVESARMLLSVILHYMEREREMQKSDGVVQKRLMVRARHVYKVEVCL